jgi:uncharacterized protein YjbI with pentapeptide repeats
MTKIANRLLDNRGNARKILNLQEAGLVEWSDAEDFARLEVVRGIQFDEFGISGVEIRLNFVECEFNRCQFKNLKTDGHWWGAEGRWTDCVFEACELSRMIAPVNSFKRCRFEGVSVLNFKPHQTLFDGCSFLHCTIQGLKAQLISNSQIVNRELRGAGQVLFQGCQFSSTSFRESYFEGVSFRGCTFDQTEATESSFQGIASDAVWWQAQKSDPFAFFLTKALDLVRTKCGRDSAAYHEFESYVIEYGNGKTNSQDFSACLYSNRVPSEEAEKVFDDLTKLVERFPF